MVYIQRIAFFQNDSLAFGSRAASFWPTARSFMACPFKFNNAGAQKCPVRRGHMSAFCGASDEVHRQLSCQPIFGAVLSYGYAVTHTRKFSKFKLFCALDTVHRQVKVRLIEADIVV